MEKLSEVVTCEYRYDTQEEREQHIEYMTCRGFICDGQIRKSNDSIGLKTRDYYWFARFFKYVY